MTSWEAVRIAIKAAKRDYAAANGATAKIMCRMMREPTNSEIGATIIRIIKDMDSRKLERQFEELLIFHNMRRLL